MPQRALTNRFSGFVWFSWRPTKKETAEAVQRSASSKFTLLKQGVNETSTSLSRFIIASARAAVSFANHARPYACSSALLLIASHALGAQGVQLFVATNGNDAWSGKLPKPNAAKTDGPLASLSGARDAIRAARAGSKAPAGPTIVQVRGGIYRLSAPFVLEPLDSGASNAPVVYEAFGKERPIFTGGKLIRGFEAKRSLWEANIPEAEHGQIYFHQLFVSAQRRPRARGPNSGYYRLAKLLPGPPRRDAKPIAPDQFGFRPGDLQPWARLSDVNLILMHSWETSIHPLRSVDTISNVVHFAAPIKEWWGIGYWEEAQRYYVENALELLDSPGEWYLNRETGVLSYWPMPGEQLNQTEVVAPVLTDLVRLDGNADEGRFVQYIMLRGLSFHHADWVLDPKGNSSTQAAVEVPAVITANGAFHCAIENCEVAHIGTYAIWFRRGCKDCRLQHNRLFDLGAGGIRVGDVEMSRTDAGETRRTLVDNNHIYDGGHVYPAGIGIWLAQSSSNRITHNDIHDLLYSGLSIGWNWNDATNRTHHNIIEFNHVHHLGHEVLSDAGLIYCLGVSPGSVIRNNVFHDMWPYSQPPFGWGIYLDATCGGYLVESNLVYNTLSGGLMYNNGGHEHVIQNNIFALSVNHALWPYFEKRPTVFRRNIVYLTQGQLFIPYGEASFKDRLAARETLGDWDSNLYWYTGGTNDLRFYKPGFTQWQELGLDRHSLIADPQFENPAGADFRLRHGSPALKIGFAPFEISSVGLYGEDSWTRETRHARCRPTALPLPSLR
ncbi:MAG TPA: right-handed parallel beta-helix repeat-containing protein [Candidatus Limnocylindrales bacterium]|nr:right-handed parallel beta-helix repeat-containing protein [Candidatus Limnocylindrales bacterium]